MNRTWAASPEPPDLTTLLEVKKEQPGYFFAERYREHWWEPLKPLVTARFEAQGPDHLNGYRGDPVYVVKEPGSHVAGLLTELFPHFALIFLLRDGRDVVDSWLAAYQDTGQVTGTKDKDYNIIWFTEQCLSNVLRFETYIQDADRDGDSDLAEFFRKAQAESRKGAEQGKELLRSRLSS